MNCFTVDKLKSSLDHCIKEVVSLRDLFCMNPGIDFSRNRKLPLDEFLQFMIQLQSKSVANELLDYFDHSLSTPSKSAFVQARDKFLPEGWAYLFHIFQDECRNYSDVLYRGYRLLACDGSDINISRDPSDERTFIKEGCGYNAIHLNALYDIQNRTYVDFHVQGKKKLHEREALNLMIDRLPNQIPSITIADRGYESFNVFAHFIEKKQFFLIRMKDICSNGILSAYDLPDDEFDTYIQTTLTRRHTKETLENVDTYTILPPYTDFDFITDRSDIYDIQFRILRFQVSNGSYVCVATNLSEEDFPLKEIRTLYRMRWSEETSFRELKYTIGIVSWHSRKYEAILQEIYARMILYNFCEVVTAHAVINHSNETKHAYKINFATAVNICRAYLKSGGDENEIMLLIQRHLTPIRNDRKYPITLRPKRNRDFVYRAA
ncbi:MAG: IS4 family transposase [Eubacteriales bacterium]|nr:IS4 family transposase [Eubacteriales bacterium]